LNLYSIAIVFYMGLLPSFVSAAVKYTVSQGLAQGPCRLPCLKDQQNIGDWRIGIVILLWLNFSFQQRSTSRSGDSIRPRRTRRGKFREPLNGLPLFPTSHFYGRAETRLGLLSIAVIDGGLCLHLTGHEFVPESVEQHCSSARQSWLVRILQGWPRFISARGKCAVTMTNILIWTHATVALCCVILDCSCKSSETLLIPISMVVTPKSNTYNYKQSVHS